ncbi:MAG: T9SS type A sorting domain-containing protein, partial [Ignavibacteria bacterium]|nr:T9SS type A sorting domain-containing protein [Ignavibacteria bacterium]
ALLPVFKQLSADRVNGYHDLEFIPWTWNGSSQDPAPIHFTENEAGQPVQDVRYFGDGKDAFRLTHNEIWSPYSNPNSQRANKTSTPFGFKLNSLTNGVFSFDIFVNTSLSGPPSKPQNLKVTLSGNYPLLTWSANIEPDVISGGKYKIYRATTTGGPPSSFNYVTWVSSSQTSWIDYDITAGSGSYKAFYKVSVADNTNKESVLSDYDWINYNPGMQKMSIIKYTYSLSENYPDPFNPTTKIRFSISDFGFASLKVFDLLGREVATLVNEPKQHGEYEVECDASKDGLSSGVYLYQLRAGSFTATKKLVYLR